MAIFDDEDEPLVQFLESEIFSLSDQVNYQNLSILILQLVIRIVFWIINCRNRIFLIGMSFLMLFVYDRVLELRRRM